MNLEQIDLRVFVRWVLFAVACLIAIIILGTGSTGGLMVVVVGYAHLFVFRPVVTPRVTDAELWRLIDG